MDLYLLKSLLFIETLTRHLGSFMVLERISFECLPPNARCTTMVERPPFGHTEEMKRSRKGDERDVERR